MSSLFLTAMQGLEQGLTQFGELQRADTDRKEKARQQALAESMEAEKLNLEKRRTRTAEELSGEQIKASALGREAKTLEIDEARKAIPVKEKERNVLLKELERREWSADRQKTFDESPEGAQHYKDLQYIQTQTTSNQATALKETSEFQKETAPERNLLARREINEKVGKWYALDKERPDLTAPLKKTGYFKVMEDEERAYSLLAPLMVAQQTGTSADRLLPGSGSSGTSKTKSTNAVDADTVGDMMETKVKFLTAMNKSMVNDDGTPTALGKNPKMIAQVEALLTDLSALSVKATEEINKGLAKSGVSSLKAAYGSATIMLDRINEQNQEWEAEVNKNSERHGMGAFGPQKPESDGTTNYPGGMDFKGTMPTTRPMTPAPSRASVSGAEKVNVDGAAKRRAEDLSKILPDLEAENLTEKKLKVDLDKLNLSVSSEDFELLKQAVKMSGAKNDMDIKIAIDAAIKDLRSQRKAKVMHSGNTRLQKR